MVSDDNIWITAAEDTKEVLYAGAMKAAEALDSMQPLSQGGKIAVYIAVGITFAAVAAGAGYLVFNAVRSIVKKIRGY